MATCVAMISFAKRIFEWLAISVLTAMTGTCTALACQIPHSFIVGFQAASGTGGVVMPIAVNELRREAIRRTLAQRAGGTPNAGTIAEATLSTWRHMAARLVPVIGARGADSLFGRAMHVTSKDFPWLAIVENHRRSASQLAGVKACLAAHDATTAAAAGAALLATFSELLATLIGESLTDRLLDPVWALPPAASAQENAS